jgi:DNA polymerase-3 subunit beta
MKIKLNSKELLERLQHLSGVVLANSALPILDNFLFEVDGQKLIVTASDLDNTMITSMNAEIDGTQSIAIPSKMLLEILKALPSQPIELVVQENGIVELVSASGNYSIAYYNGAEFPKGKQMEYPATIKIKVDALESAISNTLFACGSDDLRPIMNGVLFQLKNNSITFVSTDAHRLAKYVRRNIDTTQDVDFVVPKKPLGIIKGLIPILGADNIVEVVYNESNASFIMGSYELKTRLIDGKFPNYEGVIPKDNPNSFTVNTKEFITSLKRVSIFSDKTTHQLAIKQVGNTINLMAEDKNFNTNGSETIDCENHGGDISIGFNARFLAEALGNIDTARVVVETSAPNRAGIVKPETCDDDEEFLMLVMPVMLSK